MKKIGMLLCTVGILAFVMAGTVVETCGAGQPIPSVPGVPRTSPVSVPHDIVPLASLSGVGKAELDLTAHQIIFTDLGDHGGMGVRLFLDEARVSLGYSVVHTVNKAPFPSGGIYKLILSHKGIFNIIYFSEYEGRVTIKGLFD